MYFQYYLSVECHENLLTYLQSLIDYAGDLKCIQAHDQSLGTGQTMFLTMFLTVHCFIVDGMSHRSVGRNSTLVF